MLVDFDLSAKQCEEDIKDAATNKRVNYDKTPLDEHLNKIGKKQF